MSDLQKWHIARKWTDIIIEVYLVFAVIILPSFMGLSS